MLQDKDLQSIQEVRNKVALAHAAFLKYKTYSQEQVDRIVERMAGAACSHAEPLARLAVEETGYGNVKDKVAKNLLTCQILLQAIRPLKTAGVIREDRQRGIVEIAEPVGVVAAILPTTNPTSTAVFKILISLKARNAVVLSPHPRAVRCTCETYRIMHEAAVEAGAPEGIIQCLGEASIQGTNELMRHRLTSIVLSTGGTGIVRAAYSSGKPALGVGPGNVPVLIDSSADINKAVASTVEGKSFDYGTVCSSEQSIVAEAGRRDAVLAALKANGAYLCDERESAALAKLLFTPEFRVNPDCVGQSPQRIAELAGFRAPAQTRALAVEITGVGKGHPLSAEKLSPVLSVYFVKDFQEGIEACAQILHFGGRGHTCVIYSNDEQRIREFGLKMPAFRVLVNTPAPHGSTGITTNVFPSMTLGCGAIAGNSTSDNVGPMHLMNIKRIAYHVRDVKAAFAGSETLAAETRLPLLAAVSGASGGQDHPAPSSKIADAVSRYLAERGLTAAEGTAAPAAPRKPVASVTPSPAVEVVDRFLAGRGASPAFRPAPTPPSSAENHTAAGSSALAAPPAESPPSEIDVAPFVCEDDVRRAMVLQKKIYINRKTIVTPAARDLDRDGSILVRTE